MNICVEYKSCITDILRRVPPKTIWRINSLRQGKVSGKEKEKAREKKKQVQE